MEFKRLLQEKNRLEILKSRDELTKEGLEILSELTQALQLQQTDVMVCKCKKPKLKYKYNELGVKTYCKKCKNIYRP